MDLTTLPSDRGWQYLISGLWNFAHVTIDLSSPLALAFGLNLEGSERKQRSEREKAFSPEGDNPLTLRAYSGITRGRVSLTVSEPSCHVLDVFINRATKRQDERLRNVIFPD